MLTPDLRNQLDDLVWQRQVQTKIKADAEKETETLTAQIKDLLAAAGLSEAELAQYTVKFIPQTRESIRADLLLAAGVDPDVIKAATQVTGFIKIDVRERKVEG